MLGSLKKKMMKRQDTYGALTGNIRQTEITAKESKELKNYILDYLKKIVRQIKSKGSGWVFNVLTLEIIKMASMLLEFDIFETKQPQQAMTGIQKLINIKQGKQERKSEIAKLVVSLAKILEFDEQYFKCMWKSGITRSYTKAKVTR